MSLAARLLNVFAIPGEVFDEVKRSLPSAGNWLAPAVLLIAISWVGTWLVLSNDAINQQMREISDQAIEKQVQKGKLPKEAAEQARQIGQISIKAAAVAAPLFLAFVTPFGWGLILWLVGTKALKGNFPFMKAVEVAGLAGAISVLEAVVKTLLIIGLGNPFASPSLALLAKNFDPKSTPQSLLAVVNVMTFWVLAVRAVGLSRLSGVPFGRAAIWVFGVWALYTSALLGLGLAAQALAGG